MLPTLLVGCAPGSDLAGSAEPIVDVDAELVVHFNDAVLFCDQRLLGPIPLTVFGAASIGDAALIEYARRRLPGATPSTGPHAGETASWDGELSSNACFVPTSVQLGQMFSQIQDGFCRADFNYCVGMELALHAQSLPGGSEQSALKAAILRRARERLQAAGVEYAASLGFYERVCVSESGAPLPEYSNECTKRLMPSAGPSYLPVAHDRLVQSVSQIVSFAQAEAGLRVDVGDRRLRELPLEDPSEPVAALFGPEGTRTAGVAVFYGPPDDVEFETRWNYRRLGPVALPRVAPDDERAARALELLRQHRVPTLFGRASADGAIELGTVISPIASYNVLDHRMAADRYLAPYDEVLPADPASDMGTILRSRRALELSEVVDLSRRPFAPHESLARTEQRVAALDVAWALVVAADVYETQFGRFVFEPQVYPDGGDTSGPHLLGLLHATGAPRPSRMIASAFSDELGPTSADPLAPLLAPLARNGAGTAPSDWYAWDLRRVDGTQDELVADDVAAAQGAAGALHLLRVHLLRLGTLETAFVDAATIEQTLDLIEHAIGAVWTEYDERTDATCACLTSGQGSGGPFVQPGVVDLGPRLPPICPDRDAQPFYRPCKSCLCDLQSTISNQQRWDMYYPPELEDAYGGGAPVAVYWVDDVRCLVEERRPGTNEPCSIAGRPLPRVEGPVETRLGRTRRAHRLLPAPPRATHHYVLWRDAQGRHRLLDVVPVEQPVGVHALGGVFLDGAASAWSRDPWRAARASISASGAPRDLVPPLESELISDSDAYEDSFAHYLADARSAVSLARDQLVQARDDELVSRQNELSAQARLDEAGAVETGELADMCGDLPGCFVERTGSVTLRALGIAGAPPPPGDLGEYADCEDVLDGMYADFSARIASGFTSDAAAQTFVREHMTRVLGCTMHLYVGELAAMRIEGLPVAVRDALARGRPDDLPAYSGEVREHLLALLLGLDGARSDVRRLGSHRAAAQILIV